MFTVKFTFIKWSPLLNGRGHQIKDPNVLFYCISPPLNGHLLSTEIHTMTPNLPALRTTSEAHEVAQQIKEFAQFHGYESLSLATSKVAERK